MDIRKTLDELDALFEKRHYSEVESFLLCKIKGAEKDNDSNSIITLGNELIGFYRTASRHKDSLPLGDYIISLMKEMKLEETEAYATTFLNVATAYREAGRIDESLKYYNDVLKIYKNTVSEYDMRLASLYNNMSLAYYDKKDYEKACNLLEKALLIVDQNIGTEIMEAISRSNLALSLLKMNKVTDAIKYIEKSLSIFEKAEEPRDFHYPATLSAMGEAQFMLKNYEKALDYFTRALIEIENTIGKNSYYASICNNISLVYDKMNNKEQKDKYKSIAGIIYNKLKE